MPGVAPAASPDSTVHTADDGKAERFIQTLLREWAYAWLYYTSADRGRTLPGWLEHYDCARPHASLGGKPPMIRFPGGKQPYARSQLDKNP